MIAEIYKNKFEAAGIEVDNAVTGKEALKFASEKNFDLVLLDMVLPEMSGMEVLKELKKSGNYSPDLKVIIFSNLDKLENEQKARENGADGFIGKMQFNPSELVVELKRIIKEYGEQKKNKARFEGKTENNAGNKKRILFIEDEEFFLEMFGKKFEDDGYEVEYAKNGAWGSKMAAEKQYDIIITDMVMPAMGGDEIIRRLKLDEKTKNIPIIVISASLNEEDIAPVKEMGITDFYAKIQVVPSDLSHRVAELLK
jgi:CheY-like chemotaxis protein